MNPSLRTIIWLVAVSAVALGQGAGGAQKGKAAQAATEAARKNLLGGAGYVQKDFLKMLLSSPMLCHPMCESLGMAGDRKFDPKKCPAPEEGMPGSGEEFAGGEAGGLPFDPGMPPCPFAGENADVLFPPAEEAPAK